MKASVLFALLLVLSLSLSLRARAQAPVALAGYWNVETDRTACTYTLVRFYNQYHHLVYQERLDQLCLDLSNNTGRSRRTTRQLHATLHQVLRQQATAPPAALLAAELKRNRRGQRLDAGR